jgi:hypothetical protein
MDDDLAELGRDVGRSVSTPTRFKAGRLTVINCGCGFIKVDIDCFPRDCCESELLPPENARCFLDWIARFV